MKRPFLNIYTDTGYKTNLVFITHPFTKDTDIYEYNDALNKGVKFLGMSSYSEFPGYISNPYDVLNNKNIDAWKYDYIKLTRGWCHCFRNPDNYINNNVKKALISESDFINYEFHNPDNINIKTKEYDFIYICLKDNERCDDGWQSYNRNWNEAKICLNIMCNKYKLKGLLIGRINCEIPKSCHNIIELTDFQEYAIFIKNYTKCKFIFLPNTTDASPRVMTEAMCYNLPILVNTNILGGWKYVTQETGEEFTINNFEEILDKFIKNLDNYKPREYIIKNYGIENSGKRLLNFVKECFTNNELNFNINKIKYLKPGI
jgi:glycosyltransferase involved in cell wall biosynthesis